MALGRNVGGRLGERLSLRFSTPERKKADEIQTDDHGGEHVGHLEVTDEANEITLNYVALSLPVT